MVQVIVSHFRVSYEWYNEEDNIGRLSDAQISTT